MNEAAVVIVRGIIALFTLLKNKDVYELRQLVKVGIVVLIFSVAALYFH